MDTCTWFLQLQEQLMMRSLSTVTQTNIVELKLDLVEFILQEQQLAYKEDQTEQSFGKKLSTMQDTWDLLSHALEATILDIISYLQIFLITMAIQEQNK